MNELDILISKWEQRITWFYSYAEEAFYRRDKLAIRHLEIVIGQWRNAIIELKEVKKLMEKKNEISV